MCVCACVHLCVFQLPYKLKIDLVFNKPPERHEKTIPEVFIINIGLGNLYKDLFKHKSKVFDDHLNQSFVEIVLSSCGFLMCLITLCGRNGTKS